MNKYVKKSLFVFVPLLLSLFLLKTYISTNNFKGNLKKILKSAGLNVEFDRVNLGGFSKINIDNLVIRDQAGNIVIKAEKATAGVNLLLPSRLPRVDAYDGEIFLERYKNNKFNMFNILPPADPHKKNIDRASRIGKIYVHNSILHYSDTSFEKKIEKKLDNVSGYLDISKSRGFYLEAEGNGNGQEKIGIKLGQLVNNRESLKSLFDTRKNTDESKKEFNLSFVFKDINVNEELGQYVPIEMIKAKKGLLNGTLALSDGNPQKKIRAEGKLIVKNGTVSYVDYEGDIENADAVIEMKKNTVSVDAVKKINNNPLTFRLDSDIEKETLALKLIAEKTPFEEIAKYKLFKEANVKASGEVTGHLNVNINIKSKETDLKGKFVSSGIELAGYNFRELKTEISMTKDQILTVGNTKFHFDETIGGFKIKNDVSSNKFVYDIKQKNGSGDYTIVNKGSDYEIDRITGTGNIDRDNNITGNFGSNKINGDFTIVPVKKLMTVNAKGKDYIGVKYGGQLYEVNPDVKNLVLDFGTKGILESGTINARLKSGQNKYFDSINGQIDITGKGYGVNAYINTGGQTVNVRGTTTKELYHSYRVTSGKHSSFDVAKLLRQYGYKLKGLDTAKLPVSLNMQISGKADSLSGDYNIYSPFGRYIVEYEELYAKGKIRNLLSLNLDVNAKMEELWLGYQRFKNVTGELDIRNNILNIIDLHNGKLNASGQYNLKTGNMSINSSLNNYVLYNTVKPEVNVYIDSLTMNLNGKLDNLSGNITMLPAKTTIHSKYIGDTGGTVDIRNSVLNFMDFKLRENSIGGIYDLKTGLADITLSLNEPDIPELFEFKDLTFGTSSVLNLKGDLNKFDLTGKVIFDNISYKSFKLPQITAQMEYSDGNVDKLFKYGTFDIKEFTLYGDNGEELFRTNTKFDLENIDIDYKLENQKFTLDSVQDLKEKGYSGDIDLNFILKGKPEEFFTDLKIKSDKLILSGFPVDNLDIDVQSNNKGINIGQFYLEYEKNPLLINGYLDFAPVQYNMSVLAKDFNLAFLEVGKDIEKASGVANIDIVFSNEQTTGKVLLDSFHYKTKDKLTNVENINADINIVNRKLNVSRLDGGYNGGTFKVEGDLDVPSIPPDFMKTKRLELGKFELNADLNKVGVRYGEGIDLVLSGDVKFTENNLFGNLTVNSGEIREIPDFGGKNQQLSQEAQEKQLKEKTIVEGIVEEVIDKIVKQYTVDINILVPKDLKLNIQNVSLVKNIRGEIVGGSRMFYDSGNVSLLGNYTLKKGSFILNNNKFNLENVEIRFTDPLATMADMNPFIVFEASTSINGERIEISMNSYLKDADLVFKSDSGLEKEQILSLLAFNTTGQGEADQGGTSQDGTAVIGSLLNTTLNQLIFSPVTDKIGETLGLTNVSVKTDFEKSENTGKYSGATTLYIQDNLYKDKWFWNLEVKFPFQAKNNGTNTSNPLGYNAWINYSVFNGFEVKVGGETVTKRNENSVNYGSNIRNIKNEMNYYIGVDFSARADTFGDLMRKIFRKKKLDILTK
ncbi:MAG: translocation/assembly module TamB [Leptotrichiaceae bacterium]|nr:translocation/assembly module TamB [Leptotrichiaceae bacterium]